MKALVAEAALLLEGPVPSHFFFLPAALGTKVLKGAIKHIPKLARSARRRRSSTCSSWIASRSGSDIPGAALGA